MSATKAKQLADDDSPNSSDSPGSPNEMEQIVAPLCSIFRRYLKHHGLKFTAERAEVLGVVLKKDTLFDVDQLVHEMEAAYGKSSKATIYRTLKHLVEAGIIREVHLDGRQAHYQIVYGRKITDHLVDISNDQVVEFHCPELVELRERIAAEHGLKSIDHRFIIYAVGDDKE